ncbi:MAG: acyl-CoA/acyl-ACP dehydrogenase [Acidimicrobiales bacterium]|nr:acyl-CoA/acyl-ACP dehydrogenase [Acidimicrobiales bacterium]MCB1015655.1 acyl-CoA/acyl-ACP dehydrogenase [Acidimicrobiales bacterium]
MDFDLSEDQRALQDEARRFLDEQCPTARVRAAMAADEGYDRDLWMAMVDQGWPATAVPEGLGGLGLGTVELAVLLEQTGAHVAPTPFLQEALALDALSRAAAAGAAEAGWLDPVLQGDSVAAIAWQPVRAERDGARWLLSGRSGPALYAPEADVVVVPGVDPDGGEHLFVVNARARHVTAEPAMDQTRSLGWVELEGTPSLHLGDAEAATAFADLGAVAHAAELLGAADRVLGMTVDYAKERVQFGRPIGSFQAVKHRCADMLVDVEGMRSVVYYAAWCLSADDPDRSVAASTAKTWCSDAGRRVMASGLQVHGGIGFTWEHDLHLFLKRAQLDEVSFGDATHHRTRLAGLLRARVERGDRVV